MITGEEIQEWWLSGQRGSVLSFSHLSYELRFFIHSGHCSGVKNVYSFLHFVKNDSRITEDSENGRI